MSNKLKSEKSPYLKQHENNPVNWLAWNKDSLKKAQVEKKPIFLSIGYASCHWCHVMAHESFENIEIAKVMNDNFINIKVDREERPDLDFIFQRSLGILTGAQGGWPLSMFLDENGVPFTGGTYFPPKEMQGRPSFTQVLNNVSKVYKENREKIINQVEQMKLVFKEFNLKTAVIKQDVEPLVEKILQYMDEKNGGFKGAPKFPQLYIFDTIFYFYNKNKKNTFLDVVRKLLNNISSKGIYDHLGGGISRYTVDEKWIVPHFEKMLYDNILFVRTVNNYLVNKQDKKLNDKLIQTINFINNEFLNDKNLLGSAYDADSEGVEGKYYVWSNEEIKGLLGNDIDIFKKKYLITKEGNFEGSNILIEKDNYELNENELEILNKSEKKLLDERKKRVKPFFDDKSQTDLNSFWIYTLLHSSFVLKNNMLRDKSFELFEILQKTLKNKIYHCYNKEEEIDVFLEDYAYFALVLVSFYEVTGDIKYLSKGEEILKETWNLFYDEETKTLQKNSQKTNDLFVKPIDIIDNNIPNGNSIFLLTLNKIFNITENNIYKNKIENLTKSFYSLIDRNYSQMFSYYKTLDICENNITFTFCGFSDEFQKIRDFLLLNYFEKSTFIYKKSNDEQYILICKNQTCSQKLKNISEISNYLNERSI
ncbi:thioredoxin domain-containing protein [Candidatus Pelagibacter communis]|uniref:thioredoxin domain-containing protein n=1 Tax=Pelagibacter ubique TaxID=198252 RepID=UPI000A4703E6|nr:thioredoxin domain-containing protein [Candidatus Pelagibacter ubique]